LTSDILKSVQVKSGKSKITLSEKAVDGS